MHLSLQQAAQQTGRNRTSILRAIKRGQITGSKDAEGNWTVDAAELARVYGTEMQQPTPTNANADALVAHLQATIEDLKQERDRWHAAFESLQRRLPILTPESAQANAAPKPEPATEAPHVVATPAPERPS